MVSNLFSAIARLGGLRQAPRSFWSEILTRGIHQTLSQVIRLLRQEQLQSQPWKFESRALVEDYALEKVLSKQKIYVVSSQFVGYCLLKRKNSQQFVKHRSRFYGLRRLFVSPLFLTLEVDLRSWAKSDLPKGGSPLEGYEGVLNCDYGMIVSLLALHTRTVVLGYPKSHWGEAFADPSESDFPISIKVRSVGFFGEWRPKKAELVAWVNLLAKADGPGPEYESQMDFSGSQRLTNVRVLAYYLPQFYETPENNEWHGDGYTEWTSTRAGRKYWPSHYQPHIPHSDIGFYSLDTASALEVQSELIKKSGVDGLVFYHYWFNGRLILEKPSQILLANPSIDLPFMFCWANENWTRSWDGNNNDVLLRQDYSAFDARAFIDYLIPFLKDDRYIKLDGRPVIMVYRANLIPNLQEYLEVWRGACAENNLLEPYLIAAKTRGVSKDDLANFDAQAERVLWDWTGGGVDDNTSRTAVSPGFQGSILDYQEVSRYYSVKSLAGEVPPAMRSVVPSWDNTARYKERAHALSDPTISAFEEWTKAALKYTETQNLPFLFVNAWNEWSEGAHLEPDVKNGYAYLNAIGRATSQTDDLFPVFPKEVSIRLPDVKDALVEWKRSIASVEAALHKVGISAQWRRVEGNSADSKQDSLFINEPVLVDDEAMRALITESLRSNLVGQTYRRTQGNNVVARESGYRAVCGLEYHPFSANKKFRKLINGSQVFPLDNEPQPAEPSVTSIIRIHNKTNIRLLKKAILSLASQSQIKVKVLVCGQSLDATTSELIRGVLRWATETLNLPAAMLSFGVPEGVEDLRAEMLLGGMKASDTKFVHILDPDDQIFPGAFKFMVERLIKTEKAITFGRIFAVDSVEATDQIRAKLQSYSGGKTFDDHTFFNISPIHGFMVNRDLVDLNAVNITGMTHMEDYALLLQLVTKSNTDWQSLDLNIYIGDYNHFRDQPHQLAFISPDAKLQIQNDLKYQKDLSRIVNLQKQALRRNKSIKFFRRLEL